MRTFTVCFKVAGNLVSRASRIFLYFRWEEREGEKNTSGHSGQLPVPRRNVIIAAGHAHGGGTHGPHGPRTSCPRGTRGPRTSCPGGQLVLGLRVRGDNLRGGHPIL